MGLYYFENGALPRKPTVVYDRKYSSFTKIQVEDFLEDIYTATKCFHTTGITLALGGSCRETAVKMIKISEGIYGVEKSQENVLKKYFLWWITFSVQKIPPG